jgi:hypothetical protein
MARKKKTTPGYARLHCGGLTLAQHNAVALLVAGKNDTETAAALGLNRVTVTRWRLYSPDFQAELNVRRAEVWAVAAAKLQALISSAVDVLAEGLKGGGLFDRVGVARDVLKLAGPPPASTVGPTDPAALIRELVHERRKAAEADDDSLDEILDLPSFEDHCEQVREELNERAGSGEPAESVTVVRIPAGRGPEPLSGRPMGRIGAGERSRRQPEPAGE